MVDIVDYVYANRESFAERPLCRVDSLVLSCLSYLPIPEKIHAAKGVRGIALGELGLPDARRELAQACDEGDDNCRLLDAVAGSPRFSMVRACLAADRSDQALERQFAAVTFRLPDGTVYVAFRGTDNTLVGWKEDFNMAFRDAVPAQLEARGYLESVALQCEGPLVVGGHSKGGNLAVFATMNCEPSVRERVQRCYSHDGPGFSDEAISSASWSDAWELVEKTIPGESLIGLLLGTQGNEPVVVQSSHKGILQHDPYSWEVSGVDFVRAPALSYDAYRKAARINAWLRGMSAPERERFVEIVYRLLSSSGEVTFSGLVGSLGGTAPGAMLRQLKNLPAEDRNFFLSCTAELAATILLGPAPKIAQTPSEKVQAAVDKVDDISAKFNDTMARWERYLR